MKNLKLFLGQLALLCVASCAGGGNYAFAQATQASNMVKVCDEDCTIHTAPIGTVLQFGKGTGSTWELPFPVTISTLPLWADYTVLGDPDNGVVKEIDAQRAANAYTITYTASGSSTVQTVTVPALPVTPPPVVAGVCANSPTLNYATDGTVTITIPPYCMIIQQGGAYGTLQVGPYFIEILGTPATPMFQPGMGTNQPVGQGAAYMSILPGSGGYPAMTPALAHSRKVRPWQTLPPKPISAAPTDEMTNATLPNF